MAHSSLESKAGRTATRPSNAALVVGGGVAGARAALDLATLGHRVYLAERSHRLGGITSRLYRMFPKCFCCKVPPLLNEVARHPNIEVICSTTLSALEGEPGRFTATLTRASAPVDATRCTACGKCAAACPVGALGRDDPRDVPGTFRLDASLCLRAKGEECSLCQEACPEGAIDLGAQKGSQAVKVGSVVLATGLEQTDPRIYDTFGYGELPGVVTSLEFEGLLSPLGPTAGRLLRPDGTPAKNIAWLQCMGSREERRQKRGYCSSVCCMYAVKQARNALTADPEAAGSIFYIDLRLHPRGGEEYLAKVQGKVGGRLEFVRSRIHGASEGEGGRVRLGWMSDAGQRESRDFDLIVLSMGLGTGCAAQDMAERLGVRLREGFALTPALHPTATTRPGVYACGGLLGPADVHDSLLQASAAALAASSHLARAARPAATPLAENLDATVKTAVFVCRCGGEVSGTVDVEAVKADAETLEGVAHVAVCESLCREDEQQALVAAVRESGANRLVVAGCSERTQGALIKDLGRRAGLSPYLVGQVNLREHCGLPHADTPEEATRQAIDLVRMAVARVGASQHWPAETVRHTQSVLVIGTKLSGLSAAARLLARGFQVHLLDVGVGQMTSAVTGDGDSIPDYLVSLRRMVEEAGGEFHQGRLTKLTGAAGDFRATIARPGGNGQGKHQLKVGAVIVSAGAEELRPETYLLGQDIRVATLNDLETKLLRCAPRVRELRQAAFIQCVGSRCADNPRCSRTCCLRSVRGALALKDINPEAEVFILYRDLRTYGLYENLYRKARECGINFVRIEDEPRLGARREPLCDVLELRATDALLGQPLVLEPDLVVLATATMPAPTNRELAEALHVSLAKDGFFAESPLKMRPAETDRPGIYICGGAKGPGTVRELLASAEAAAAKAASLLAERRSELWPTRSEVNVANCDGCGYCVDPCAYGALSLYEFTEAGELKKLARVNTALCAGCGVCQATCPKKGISVRGYDIDSLSAALDAALSPH